MINYSSDLYYRNSEGYIMQTVLEKDSSNANKCLKENGIQTNVDKWQCIAYDKTRKDINSNEIK